MILFAASDWATYVIPTLIVLSLISKLFSKNKEDQSEAPPVMTPTTGAGKELSWEEEIKRLLEGQTPVTPPASTPAPPPLTHPQPLVIVHQEPPAPPVIRRRPQIEETESHETHELPAHSPRLLQAETALARAGQLHEAVAQRLESVDRATENARPALVQARYRRPSAEVESVLAMLRQPRTARQVFIAQAVIGPPKGIEN